MYALKTTDYLRICSITKPCLCGALVLKLNNNGTYNNTPSLYQQSRNLSVPAGLEQIARIPANVIRSLSESTPVEYTQKCLIYIHDTTGLPWWGTIVLSTVLLRTVVTVPLAAYQSCITAKVENLYLEMPDIAKNLKREVGMAVKMYNWDEKTARLMYRRSIKKQWNKLIIRDNCHPAKTLILVWFQIPMWIFLSLSLRNIINMVPNQDAAAYQRYTELTVEGFGWICDLTQVDPTWILPVSMGLLNLAIIEMQTLSKLAVPTKFQKTITNVFRGVSILMVPVAATVPSCLALYWTASSAFGLVQNLVLISPKVKRFFGIPQSVSEVEKPYSHMLAGARYKIAVSIVMTLQLQFEFLQPAST